MSGTTYSNIVFNAINSKYSIVDNTGNILTYSTTLPTNFSIVNKNKLDTLELNPPSLKTALENLLRKSYTETGEQLIEFMCRFNDNMQFIAENTQEDSTILSDSKKQFDKEKNKLITLMTKNENIQNKLKKRKIYNLIFTVILFLYIFFLTMMYSQAMNMIPGVVSPLTKQSSFVIIIGISITVLLVSVLIDAYYMIKRKDYEGFQSDTCEYTSPLTTSSVENYIDKLQASHEITSSIKLVDDTKKSEIIQSILTDYDNINYENMRRYQLTDYKINESRNNFHFMKYAYIMISIIGILAGLYIRQTTIMSAENAANTFGVTRDTFIGGSVLLIISYLIMYMLHSKQNKIRKKYNWNKLYWNIKAVQQNKTNN
jgi:hypothetical protein